MSTYQNNRKACKNNPHSMSGSMLLLWHINMCFILVVHLRLGHCGHTNFAKLQYRWPNRVAATSNTRCSNISRCKRLSKLGDCCRLASRSLSHHSHATCSRYCAIVNMASKLRNQNSRHGITATGPCKQQSASNNSHQTLRHPSPDNSNKCSPLDPNL